MRKHLAQAYQALQRPQQYSDVIYDYAFLNYFHMASYPLFFDDFIEEPGVAHVARDAYRVYSNVSDFDMDRLHITDWEPKEYFVPVWLSEQQLVDDASR